MALAALSIAACKRDKGAPSWQAPPRETSAGTLGLGREPAAEDLRGLQPVIMPDGRGLPRGHGTPEAGAAIYAARCAGCHGREGEGASALPLVGAGESIGFRVGRAPAGEPRPTWVSFYPYATTLFDYTLRAMPWSAPGSLSDDDAYAVVAWLLRRNGLIAAGAVLDAGSLPRVQMPARARFVFEGPGATVGR
jgi:mono/diheme cytochrome c family protein